MKHSQSFFFRSSDLENLELNRIESCLEKYASATDSQVYLICKPMLCKRPYQYDDCFAILIPGKKVVLACLESASEYTNYCADFIDDLSTFSNNYDYVSKIGRPREWENLIAKIGSFEVNQLSNLIEEKASLSSDTDKRKSRLLISLLLGSINDIKKINLEPHQDILDLIKQRIILFDAEQSRFIYKRTGKKRTTIQGLAGTGKTELLFHKLRELYESAEEGTRIFFTCYNKVLADSLRKRIPAFFDFMRVNKQIDWDSRLIVAPSWGSERDPQSGLYSFICNFYKIRFLDFGHALNFDAACSDALSQIPPDAPPCLDYLLVDESQDFPKSFFDLCDRVTKEDVYVAGDLFQDIYEVRDSSNIQPDYLLNNCYRTDPRTLLFSHALSLGLYETPVIRWLSLEVWELYGYHLSHSQQQNTVQISRNPINRFGLDDPPVIQNPVQVCFTDDYASQVISIIEQLRDAYPTIEPNDVAVVFIGSSNRNYEIADQIELQLKKKFSWNATKGYKTKRIEESSVFVSNRNNIKGLEFPFVICYAIGEITRGRSLRNALYMVMTRSFISSYLILPDSTQGTMEPYSKAARALSTNSSITVRKPEEDEIAAQEELAIAKHRPAKSLADIARECIAEHYGSPDDAIEKKIISLLAVKGNDYEDEESIRGSIIAILDIINEL